MPIDHDVHDDDDNFDHDLRPETDGLELTGLELRYAAILVLGSAGVPLTLAELVRDIEVLGFSVGRGRRDDQAPPRPAATKVLADALRWEVRRGRVRRVGRGLYAPGSVHRSSRYRARVRLAALRQGAASGAWSPQDVVP